MKGAQLNYPVHEQEMLSIILALKRWRVDLMGTKIEIYTDHQTLETFDEQKDLSRRQSRWMKYSLQYEYEIHYVKGEDNTVADALSQLEGDDSPDPEPLSPISAVFSIASDPELIKNIKAGYKDNPFTSKIMKDIKSKMITPSSEIQVQDGLLYLGQHLAIPQT